MATMPHASFSVYNQVLYTLRNFNQSNSEALLDDLEQYIGFGVEGDILVLQSCLHYLEVFPQDLKTMPVDVVLEKIFRDLLQKPNFSTIFSKAFEGTTFCGDFLEQIFNRLRLETAERIQICFALSASEDQKLKMCGKTYCTSQIEMLRASQPYVDSAEQIQNIVFLLLQSDSLSEHVSYFIRMLLRVQSEVEKDYILQPFLSSELPQRISARNVDLVSGSSVYDFDAPNQWCKLPQDLLDLIVGKLYYTDRIRFRKVCKDWCIPIGTRMDNELPWILCYSVCNRGSKYPPIKELTLLDPIHKKIHKIFSLGGRHSKLLSSSRICGTKSGWLIFKENGTEDGLCIFLYNPFNGDLFRLPTLISRTWTSVDQLMFSSTNPMSPDCIFAVIHADFSGRVNRVFGFSTYLKGDNNWKTKIIDGGGYEFTSIRSLCTRDGFCYIVFCDGKLASICLENQEWNWLVEYQCWEKPNMVMHLVEFNGGLLTVKHYYDYGTCDVYRFEFDKRERGWIEVKSLGNRALFLDFRGGCVRSNMSDLANTILRIPLRGNFSRVAAYTLKDEKSLEKVEAYDWMEIPNLGRKMWIEPPYA